MVWEDGVTPHSYTAIQGGGVDGADTDGLTAGDESVMYKQFSDSPDWTLGEDGYWYYTKLLPAGDCTDSLLQAVVMATNADMGRYENTEMLYSVADTSVIHQFKQKVEQAQAAYEANPTEENLLALTQAESALEGAYGWTTEKPADVDTITYVQRGNQLDTDAKGYANAKYTLTITTEVLQATAEAVEAEWGRLPNVKGGATQIAIAGLTSALGEDEQPQQTAPAQPGEGENP